MINMLVCVYIKIEWKLKHKFARFIYLQQIRLLIHNTNLIINAIAIVLNDLLGRNNNAHQC